MTDEELLELAAKAAGIDLWHENVFTNGLTQKISENGVLRWNPLTNDGDALRLAVKLNFFVQLISEINYVEVIPNQKDDDKFVTFGENLNDDPCAATRRAIVRAAAEIGITL